MSNLPSWTKSVPQSLISDLTLDSYFRGALITS